MGLVQWLRMRRLQQLVRQIAAYEAGEGPCPPGYIRSAESPLTAFMDRQPPVRRAYWEDE